MKKTIYEKYLVTPKIGRLLKELGFDEPTKCIWNYPINKLAFCYTPISNNKLNGEDFCVPTIFQAWEWIAIKYNKRIKLSKLKQGDNEEWLRAIENFLELKKKEESFFNQQLTTNELMIRANAEDDGYYHLYSPQLGYLDVFSRGWNIKIKRFRKLAVGKKQAKQFIKEYIKRINEDLEELN